MLEQNNISRATESDIEACAVIEGILNDVSRGVFPRLSDGGYHDSDPSFFNPEDPSHLREFFQRVTGCLETSPGSMGRVVWGYQAILSSNLVDTNKNHLAMHPRIEKALEAYGTCQLSG